MRVLTTRLVVHAITVLSNVLPVSFFGFIRLKAENQRFLLRNSINAKSSKSTSNLAACVGVGCMAGQLHQAIV